MFEVKNLSFSYPKSTNLLENISFSIETGEIMAILGPNGAGKTTLLKCMLGLLEAKEGSCLLHGEPIQTYGKNLWKEMGYVPQARNYRSTFSVEDMVLLGRNAHINATKQPTKEDYDLVEEKMDYLGILHLWGKNCNAISGGELQMVLLARTLASEPKFLILDEPESNLDYYNQLTVLESMKKLATEGIACLFNTHYPDHALRIADKSLLLKKGKPVSFGTSQEVINTENLAHTFAVNTHISDITLGNEVFSSIVCLNKVEHPSDKE
ncbi:MAG: ABC transporter ATP-binding protein [Eubacteriales bacterium]